MLKTSKFEKMFILNLLVSLDQIKLLTKKERELHGSKYFYYYNILITRADSLAEFTI